MSEQLQQMQLLLQKSLIKIKNLEEALENNKSIATANTKEPIAIIGTGVRLANNITSTKNLFELLISNKDVISKIPTDRFNVDEIYNEDASVAGKTNSKFGAFLSNDVRAFDAEFFGISPREAKSIDPLQRMILEVVYEALENAGIASDTLKGSNSGMYWITRSSHDSLPSSTNMPINAEVKAFVVEPIAKMVSAFTASGLPASSTP